MKCESTFLPIGVTSNKYFLQPKKIGAKHKNVFTASQIWKWHVPNNIPNFQNEQN